MKVTVSKKNLVRILSRCQGVAAKKGTMPMLACVLLATDGPDTLRVSATDLYLSVSGTVPAEVGKSGSVAIVAKDLFDRVKMMPEGNIVLDVSDGSKCTIKAPGSQRRFTIMGVPGEEFPTLPEPGEQVLKFEVPVTHLVQLISRTHFAISADETRLHLNSALLELDDGKLRMVATDGHRLAKAECKFDSAARGKHLIPLKAVGEIRRVCEELDDGAQLELAIDGPHAFVSNEEVQLSMKLVDAQFPPYGQVIPDSCERTVSVSRQALADSMRAVSIAASDRNGGVKLTLSKGKLRIETETPEHGAGFDELDVDFDGGACPPIGFNAHYLLDVLGATESNDVTLGMGSELDPVLVRPSDAPESFTSVIMPMRMN